MHDPMVVAFTIRSPRPRRSSLGSGTARWQRHGPWWRPGSWSPFVTAFGREWYFPAMVTIWHVEPGGRDMGEVCKHSRRWQDITGAWHIKHLRRWRWHVHHWRIQVALLGVIKRFLFERCIECHRRFPWGYAPVSHQWDGPRARWFRKNELAYHHECSGLVLLRHAREVDERLIRAMFAAYRLTADLDEEEALAQITNPRLRTMEFADSYRLTRLLGYERDDDYNLVRQGVSS